MAQKRKAGVSEETFDEFLASQGILEACEDHAIKELVAEQLAAEAASPLEDIREGVSAFLDVCVGGDFQRIVLVDGPRVIAGGGGQVLGPARGRREPSRLGRRRVRDQRGQHAARDGRPEAVRRGDEREGRLRAQARRGGAAGARVVRAR